MFSNCAAAATFSAVTSRAVPVAPTTVAARVAQRHRVERQVDMAAVAPQMARLVVEHRFARQDAAEHRQVALGHLRREHLAEFAADQLARLAAVDAPRRGRAEIGPAPFGVARPDQVVRGLDQVAVHRLALAQRLLRGMALVEQPPFLCQRHRVRLLRAPHFADVGEHADDAAGAAAHEQALQRAPVAQLVVAHLPGAAAPARQALLEPCVAPAVELRRQDFGFHGVQRDRRIGRAGQLGRALAGAVGARIDVVADHQPVVRVVDRDALGKALDGVAQLAFALREPAEQALVLDLGAQRAHDAVVDARGRRPPSPRRTPRPSAPAASRCARPAPPTAPPWRGPAAR